MGKRMPPKKTSDRAAKCADAVTVYIGTVALYGPPEAVVALKLVPTTLNGEVVYVLPQQAEAMQERGLTLMDAVKLGFGVELGAIAAEGAVDLIGDILFEGGSRLGARPKPRPRAKPAKK